MDKKLRAVIIDDEIKARETVKEMLNLYCPEIVVVGEGNNVLSGRQVIKDTQPDLVFLDIHMPDGTGFDLLNKVDYKAFSIVFLTAYDEFAIRAFKFNAIDYLLKPLDPDDLITAIESVVERHEMNVKDFYQVIDNFKKIEKDAKKMVLKTLKSVFLVNISDIIRCESSGNYTNFHMVDQKQVMVSNTLKEYNELLGDYGFFRVHQSHLINLDHVMRLDKADGGVVFLSQNHTVPVATRKKEFLIKVLNEV